MGDQQQTINALREALTRIEERDPDAPVPDFLDVSKPAGEFPQDAGSEGPGSTAEGVDSDAPAAGAAAVGSTPGGGFAREDVSDPSADRVDSEPSSPEDQDDTEDVSGDLESLSPEQQYEKARTVVLRKLTGSPKTRQQLATALTEKEFSSEIITRVLDRMEEVHLINDAEFARTWVRGRHEIKNLGKSALRRELREKGVSEPDTEQALEQLSDEDELAAARELVERKLRDKPVPAGSGPEERAERDKITRRLVSMLARRGHAPGTAFQIVREVLDERASA